MNCFLKKKRNFYKISNFSKNFSYKEHRWRDCINLFEKYENSNSDIILESFYDHVVLNNNLDKFQKEYKKNKIDIFIHHTPTVGFPWTSKHKLKNILNNIKILNIRNIFVLSKQNKIYLTNFIQNKNIISLTHPIKEIKSKFNFEQWLNKKEIYFPGGYLRNVVPFLNLKTDFQKYMAFKLDCFKRQAEKQNLTFNKVIFFRSKEKLSREDYIQLTANKIGFLNLYDSSANNSILEHIETNTPLLINKLPAVVEYLGENYPYYYKDAEEANKKINNVCLIKETHEYLKNMDKEKFSFDFFTKTFLKIYNE